MGLRISVEMYEYERRGFEGPRRWTGLERNALSCFSSWRGFSFTRYFRPWGWYQNLGALGSPTFPNHGKDPLCLGEAVCLSEVRRSTRSVADAKRVG